MANNVLIIALGSNTNQNACMARAKKLLRTHFGGTIFFTRDIWTQPIGIVSDKFLNSLAITRTDLGFKQIEGLLKSIEAECGNTNSERKRNIVRMDIDILLLGEVKYHPKDWQRGYVKELLAEFNEHEQNQ